MKNIRIFYLKIFIFWVVKFSVYLNRHVFLMRTAKNLKYQKNFISPTFGVVFLFNWLFMAQSIHVKHGHLTYTVPGKCLSSKRLISAAGTKSIEKAPVHQITWKLAPNIAEIWSSKANITNNSVFRENRCPLTVNFQLFNSSDLEIRSRSPKSNQFFVMSQLLFVCVEVLRSSQPNGVMSSTVSLPNHMFTGQA